MIYFGEYTGGSRILVEFDEFKNRRHMLRYKTFAAVKTDLNFF